MEAEIGGFTKQPLSNNNLLWASHYSKSFAYIISFNTQKNNRYFYYHTQLAESLKNLPEATQQQSWELNLANLTPDSVVLTPLHHFDVDTNLRVSQYNSLVSKTTSFIDNMKREWKGSQLSLLPSSLIHIFIHSFN